jgi:hypothetical protein
MTGAFACIADDHVHLRPWGVSAIGSGNGARMLSTVPSVAVQSLDLYQKPLVDLPRQGREYLQSALTCCYSGDLRTRRIAHEAVTGGDTAWWRTHGLWLQMGV